MNNDTDFDTRRAAAILALSQVEDEDFNRTGQFPMMALAPQGEVEEPGSMWFKRQAE
jgi:hypothetical protein